MKEIEFCDLQEWLKEEVDETIINTRQLFRVIKGIVNKGFKIDCFVCWSDDVNEINRIDVDINNIPENHFTLFNDTYFNYH